MKKSKTKRRKQSRSNDSTFMYDILPGVILDFLTEEADKRFDKYLTEFEYPKQVRLHRPVNFLRHEKGKAAYLEIGIETTEGRKTYILSAKQK